MSVPEGYVGSFSDEPRAEPVTFANGVRNWTRGPVMFARVGNARAELVGLLWFGGPGDGDSIGFQPVTSSEDGMLASWRWFREIDSSMAAGGTPREFLEFWMERDGVGISFSPLESVATAGDLYEIANEPANSDRNGSRRGRGQER